MIGGVSRFVAECEYRVACRLMQEEGENTQVFSTLFVNFQFELERISKSGQAN